MGAIKARDGHSKTTHLVDIYIGGEKERQGHQVQKNTEMCMADKGKHCSAIVNDGEVVAWPGEELMTCFFF